jgi:hypothetical protein
MITIVELMSRTLRGTYHSDSNTGEDDSQEPA